MVILIIALFATAACGAAGYVAISELTTSKVERRLRLLMKPQAAEDDKPALLKDSLLLESGSASSLAWRSFVDRFRLDLLFEQAGISMTGRQLLVLMAVSAIAVFLALYWSPVPPFLLPPAVVAALGIPMGVLHVVRRRRLNRFARQLPDALELIARALRSGNSLVVATQIVADDMVGPVAAEFGVFCRAQSLGTSVDQALDQLCRRVPNADLQFFANCVLMQREMGGNLAELCEKIAQIVRERFRILSQVQALTGEGRLSGTILLALPVLLFFTIHSLSPEYVSLLFTDALGRKMLAIAGVLQLVGALAIRKIVNFQV